MEKFSLLVYMIIICSSFMDRNRHRDEKGHYFHHASQAQEPVEKAYDRVRIDCHPDPCPEPLLLARIPRKPGCICKPDYIYRVGNLYKLVYKPSSARGDTTSVTLVETKISKELLTMLNNSRNKKIFVNGNTARLKAKELQMKTL